MEGLSKNIKVVTEEACLEGILTMPSSAKALVVFAHGSGSSRFSPRNTFVAQFLAQRGLGTLLLDLLTAEEAEEDMETHALRFDIDLLTRRLVGTTDFLLEYPPTAGSVQGYFGSSTGAAAALVAASLRPHVVGAVVSRGGRPDLALKVLSQVRCPTLLIVGGADFDVLQFNREVLPRLGGVAELKVVPHATHLFPEKGALEEVCRLAGDWFSEYLLSFPEEIPMS